MKTRILFVSYESLALTSTEDFRFPSGFDDRDGPLGVFLLSVCLLIIHYVSSHCSCFLACKVNLGGERSHRC